MGITMKIRVKREMLFRMGAAGLLLSALATYPGKNYTVHAAEAQSSAAGSATVFEGARLIVGDGTTVIEDSAFMIETGLIVAVGRQGELDTPADATRIDLSGKAVMPAKVDLHG